MSNICSISAGRYFKRSQYGEAADFLKTIINTLHMNYTDPLKRELKSWSQDQETTLDLLIGMNTLVHFTRIVYTHALLNNDREAKLVVRSYLLPKSTLRR